MDIFVYSLDNLLKCVADTIVYMDTHYFILVAGHQVSIVDAGLTAMIVDAIFNLIFQPLTDVGGSVVKKPNQGD